MDFCHVEGLLSIDTLWLAGHRATLCAPQKYVTIVFAEPGYLWQRGGLLYKWSDTFICEVAQPEFEREVTTQSFLCRHGSLFGGWGESKANTFFLFNVCACFY